jgi:hypothetical protein
MQFEALFMGTHLQTNMAVSCQYVHQYLIDVPVIRYSFCEYNIGLFKRESTL